MNTELWMLMILAAGVAGEKWKFPEGSASVRIDTKLQFLDDRPSSDRNNVQADEPAPFQPARDTSGFYNRPAGAPGRYPVRVETHDARRTMSPHQLSDGTLDSMLQCRCVSSPDCSQVHDSTKVCGADKYLCCVKRPNKASYPKPEFFNEVEDERAELYPGQSSEAGLFPSIPGPGNTLEREYNYPRQQPILIGPGGPVGTTGPIGPPSKQVLVGPQGPTGIVGPAVVQQNNPGVLVGPGGPTGVIGPGVNKNVDDVGSSASAQRGVLVGPGGPTGIIGPAGYGNRPILVGPSGPTGVVGPYGYGGNQMRNPGILVGPGGPTGIIGPGRQILVGPGGPSGHIGPRRPFYYGNWNK